MNEFVQNLSSFFAFNLFEIIGLSLLLLFFIIQVVFYFKYYRKPLKYAKSQSEDSMSVSSFPKVSVIIESENEADSLAEVLPLILEQDYPDFEVVVVNNGSTDESDQVLEQLKLKYNNLYQTFLPHSNDKAYGYRKLALTLGIKAAKGDVLLFTESYSKPISNRWISSMVQHLSDQKDIVLGYSYYRRTSKFFNMVARFDNLLYGMQYLSMAIKNKPFTGTYRNVAFKKHLFYDNKGFASHLYLENGEDVFINQIVNKSNTAVALSQDSFIETAVTRFSLWQQIKKSYSIAQSNFKTNITSLFSFEAFSRLLFYILFIALAVYGGMTQNWGLLGCAGLLFILRLVMQDIIINKAAKYFMVGKYHASLPLLDIVQPLYNMKFRTRQRRKLGRR